MRTARPARAGSSNHLYERRLTYATGGGDDDAGITVGCSVQSSGDAVIGLMIGHGAQPSHPANEKYPREERCRISHVTARSRNSCHLRASQSTAGKGDEKKADGAAKTKTPIRYASYEVSL